MSMVAFISSSFFLPFASNLDLPPPPERPPEVVRAREVEVTACPLKGRGEVDVGSRLPPREAVRQTRPRYP